MSAIRTTVAGGIIFFLPFGLIVFLMGELVDIALLVAEPLASFFPSEDVFGQSAATVLAWFLIGLGCYLAGALARWSALSSASDKLGGFLANIVPGYRQISGSVAEYLLGKEASSEMGKPVRVRYGSMIRIGFEISRDAATGIAVVYLPNTPDPFSGILAEVATTDLDPIPAKTTDVMHAIEFYGHGLPTAADRDTG